MECLGPGVCDASDNENKFLNFILFLCCRYIVNIMVNCFIKFHLKTCKEIFFSDFIYLY